MFFDDRLATVLRHRADGEAAARTQYRQLLDLLGQDDPSRAQDSDQSLVAAAWLRLEALAEIIPVKQRADIVRDAGWRLNNPELVAFLAEDEAEVASAAIAQAELTEKDWVDLIPHLPIRARGFMRHQTGLPEGAEAVLEQLGVHDRGLPQPANSNAPLLVSDKDTMAEARTLEGAGETQLVQPPRVKPSTSAPPSAPPAGSAKETEKSEIAELVERIAQFRKDREPASAPSESSPRLPLDDPAGPRSNRNAEAITSFAFAADTAGRIEWAERPVAAMVIGKRLIPPRQLGTAQKASLEKAANSRDEAAYAFTRHQPISGAMLTLDGAPSITGDWVVDAEPRFARSGGRFHGYIGRMRRPCNASSDNASSEADRVRQLLHELRTPVNALQGFAEIIQQQLFGPAPNEYRALAANIAGDSARILAGLDELERLARLESGAMSLAEGSSDIGPILERMIAQLQAVLASRNAAIELDKKSAKIAMIAVNPDDTEAMIWRIMASLVGSCGASEKLQMDLKTTSDSAAVTWQLPKQLLAHKDAFSAEVTPSGEGLSAGLFGAGFSLRLARAEAQAVGGDLVIADSTAQLTLPLYR